MNMNIFKINIKLKYNDYSISMYISLVNMFSQSDYFYKNYM